MGDILDYFTQWIKLQYSSHYKISVGIAPINTSHHTNYELLEFKPGGKIGFIVSFNLFLMKTYLKLSIFGFAPANIFSVLQQENLYDCCVYIWLFANTIVRLLPNKSTL